MKEQKDILKIRTQRLLNMMAEQNPFMPFTCRIAGSKQAAAWLWNEREIIGCAVVGEAKWKGLAEEAVEDWMAKIRS